MSERKDVLVFCGPSGVGKGTLVALLQKRYTESFSFCVSNTTRKARPGEKDGVHYNFVSKEKMEAAIENGDFAEHAKVHDNYYGTRVDEIEKAKLTGVPILEIDVQGARQINTNHPNINALFVFVKPPSIESLRDRLIARSTESAEKIETRVSNAKAEIEASTEPFWDGVFVNDDLNQCFEQISEFLKENLNLAKKKE